MPTPGNGAIGSLDLSDARRKELSQTSHSWSCPECKQSNGEILKTAPVQTASSETKNPPVEEKPADDETVGNEPEVESTPTVVKDTPPSGTVTAEW